MTDKSDKKKFTRKQLDAAMRKVYASYRHRSNFTGADVGYRWNGEERTDQQVVRVHVDAKLPIAELSDAVAFPKEIDGIPLDVIEGPYKANKGTDGPKGRAPVLMGGVSVGRLDNSAGTLGAIVIDEETRRPGILSNWHVLAGPRGKRGDAVIQPGAWDGGARQDAIAHLSRWMLDLDGDAAVADLNAARSWLPVQIGSYDTFDGHRNSRLNEVLVKHGRSTSRTSARVDGEGIYRVFYEVQPGQIEARDIQGFKLVPEAPGNYEDIEISEGGDSGSLWYSATDKNAVGLHFAGENSADPSAERAIACNLPRVLSRLGVRLATYDDVVEMAEAAARGQGGGHTALAPRVRQELTPAPDWPWPVGPVPLPDWPWPVDPLPPHGGPYPPFPPYPWPLPPIPAPWWPRGGAPMPRRGRARMPESFETGPGRAIDRRTAPVGRDVLRPEKFSPQLYQETWELLKDTMICWGGPEFEKLRKGDRVDDWIHSPYPHNEIAFAVRDCGYFDGLIWEDRLMPAIFLDCVIFHHVAEELLKIRR